MIQNIIIPQPKKYSLIQKRIIKGGYKNLHILADFDRTITKAFVGKGKEVSSTISILRKEKYLTKSYSDAAYALFDRYHPIEVDSSLPMDVKVKAMAEWWEKHTELLIKSKLNIRDIIKASKSANIAIRKSAQAVFSRLNQNQVPLVIMSASGLGVESIEETLKHHHLNLPNVSVISNQLIWDENGFAVDYRRPLIHTFNKTETIIKNYPIYSQLTKRRNIILLGDSIGDIGMAHGFEYENILKIGFLNYKIDENLEDYKNAFDVILTHDASMDFVLSLLNDLN